MNTKLLVTILFFLSAISCSSPTQENAAQQEPAADTLKQSPAVETEKMENEHEGEEHVAPLSLNNGLKWKADNVTNENVKAIRKVVSEFESMPNPSLHDYHHAAEKITAATNKLLSDCRMTGQEHEALHTWLLPLIGDTKKLLDSQEPTEAAKVYSGIKERLNLYNHYFD